MFLTRDEALIGIVSDAIDKVTGRRPALSTSGGTSDARFIKDYCPVVEFGPVGRHHASDRRARAACGDRGDRGDLRSDPARLFRGMMGGLTAVRDNLAGALEVMLGRPEGLNRLDTSLDGFWRSFGAVVLVAPFALLSLLSQQPLAVEAGRPPAPLTGARLALYGIALLVDWFAFPLVFALLARPFGLGSRYVPFIVARNWASVIIGAMVAVVHVLHLLGVLPTVLLPYALLVAIAVSLRFSYVIARTTLLVSMAMALPIVILDLLLSLTIWSLFDRFS